VVIGFRAPYNKVDAATLAALEEEGFLYDASMVSGWKVLYPRMDSFSIGEIPVSSIFGLPLEDVVWLHYLKMPSVYFYLLKNKENRIESFLFHPHHIAKQKESFEEFIKYLKGENIIFISHSRLTETDEGV
jgi:hypothetical protein